MNKLVIPINPLTLGVDYKLVISDMYLQIIVTKYLPLPRIGNKLVYYLL